jgi:hypothetical protein
MTWRWIADIEESTAIRYDGVRGHKELVESDLPEPDLPETWFFGLIEVLGAVHEADKGAITVRRFGASHSGRLSLQER